MLGTVPANPFWELLSLAVGSFLTHTHLPLLEGGLLQFSRALSAAFSSPVLCPGNPGCLLALSSPLRVPWPPPGFPVPMLPSGNSPNAAIWGDLQAHIVYFPCLRKCFPLLPDVHGIKTLVLYIFLFFLFRVRKVNPCYTNWPDGLILMD